jgi:pilus assembly protein CpaE
MKIKVLSANADRARTMADMVRTSGPGMDVHSGSGTVANLLTAVNGSRPDLVLLDDVDSAGLDAIARLTQQQPDVELIVLSAVQTPEFLLRAMQVGVREVLPELLDSSTLQAAVRRAARKRAGNAPAPKSMVLAFMACKGGSGASFLAANLAHVLSRRDGRSVALLDLDLQFGDTLLMLSDQRTNSDVAEVARNIARLDADLLSTAMVQVSETLSVLPAPAELSQALEVKVAHVQAIIRQAREMYDFVVLDVGRSIDALSLTALDHADRIFPVVQLSLPQARDAKRLRDLFRSLEYPPSKIQWIVNRYQKGGEVTLDAMEQALGSNTLVTVPNHYAAVSASVNQGVPIDQLAPKNAVTRALHDLAAAVAPMEVRKKETWLSSLFGGGRSD